MTSENQNDKTKVSVDVYGVCVCVDGKWNKQYTNIWPANGFFNAIAKVWNAEIEIEIQTQPNICFSLFILLSLFCFRRFWFAVFGVVDLDCGVAWFAIGQQCLLFYLSWNKETRDSANGQGKWEYESKNNCMIGNDFANRDVGLTISQCWCCCCRRWQGIWLMPLIPSSRIVCVCVDVLCALFAGVNKGSDYYFGCFSVDRLENHLVNHYSMAMHPWQPIQLKVAAYRAVPMIHRLICLIFSRSIFEMKKKRRQ